MHGLWPLANFVLLPPTNSCMSKMRLRRSCLAKKQEPGPRLSPLTSTPKVRGRCGGRQGTRKKKMPQRPRIANDAQIVVKQLPVDEKASKTLEISGVRTALSRRSRVYAYRHGPSMPCALAIGCRDKWI